MQNLKLIDKDIFYNNYEQLIVLILGNKLNILSK